MRAAELLGSLGRLRVFTTRDPATLAGLTPVNASQALRRLATDGLVARVRRGIRVNRQAPGLHPAELVQRPAFPWPADVSPHSALSIHGQIEEVPQIVQAVSPKHPVRRTTLMGDIRFHRLPSRLIRCFHTHRTGQGRFPLAEPEKASLDLAHLALIPRSPLGFPKTRDRAWRLNRTKVFAYARRFSFAALLAWTRRQRFSRSART